MTSLDKNSAAYKKYVQPVKDREAKAKKQSQKQWWKENWIALCSLTVSFMALIVSLIALLK